MLQIADAVKVILPPVCAFHRKQLTFTVLLTSRPYSHESDKPHMSALATQFHADHLHVIDLPYLLSSWPLDDPENVRLWFGNDINSQVGPRSRLPSGQLTMSAIPPTRPCTARFLRGQIGAPHN
jgi:hypothetical protein